MGRAYAGSVRESLNADGLCLVDLSVGDDGRIARVAPAGGPPPDGPALDARRKMALPCFVDLHTHIGARPARATVAKSAQNHRMRVVPGWDSRWSSYTSDVIRDPMRTIPPIGNMCRAWHR